MNHDYHLQLAHLQNNDDIIIQENSMKIKLDRGEGEYCGVDVDKVDMIKYPSLQSIPWWSAHLIAGDCIYVPFG